MKHFEFASLVALAVGATAVPGFAQDTGTPGGFRLPTNPSPAPTATDVQGPVDPDAPILTRPRAPTPTPTPRATATPTPPPAVQPAPTPMPSPQVTSPTARSSSPPRVAPRPTIAPPASQTSSEGATSAPVAAPDLTPAPLPTSTTEPVPGPVASVAAPAESSDEGVPGWLYALGGLLLAGGLGAALWWRRRSEVEAEAPAIVAPRVPPANTVRPEPAAPSPAKPTGPVLAIEAQAKQLARSMRFATLSYELRITNRGPVPLEEVTFGADLVTAHARVPAQAQLADPSVALAPVQTGRRLDPGESTTFSGEFRLPVEDIRPITHGKAVVYVPLLRVRAEAAGSPAVARTFIVGLQNPGAQRLQPFRLDEMPQVYHSIGSRALD